MTPQEADKLIGKTIKLVDQYGSMGVLKITRRDRRHLYGEYQVGTFVGYEAKIDRSDIAVWEINTI
jgi:hypothetical protein